jgi:glycosyltransferase involved in cell wall biosynthesis
MHIALTVDPELPVPPTHYGGIERVVDMLARTLSARGHSVTLFANAASTCPVSRVDWPGASSVSHIDSLRNSLALAREVTSGNYDIVHSVSRIAYLAPLLPLRIPKLMSYHRNISSRTTGLACSLSRGTLEFSALSRHMIDAAPLPGRWHLTPNGVPLPLYDFQDRVEPEASLVFLGRIEEIKGPHLAIEVARRVGRKLVIAGNVPDEHRNWFAHHIAPHIDGANVRYLGPVDDAQKNELLGKAFAFLMPILWEEPFGLVMAEAMACGTPVVGLRRGAAPDIIDNGVTGFVVDTVDEMAAAIDRVGGLSRAAARARVERLYSGEAMTDNYAAVYEDMIERLRRKAR